MPKVTAMYIFSGYRDFIKAKNSEADVNYNFSGGGEIESAVRISQISELFDKGFVFPKSKLPGLLEYEVLETFGRVIAEKNIEENHHDDSYYLSILIFMVMSWILKGEEK